LITKSCEGIDLTETLVCDLIFETQLDESVWDRSIITNVDFYSSFFWHSSFFEADLKSVLFYDTDSTDNIFDKVKFNDVTFRGGSLDGSVFRESKLSNVHFGKNNLGGEVSLRNVDFTDATFENVSFRGALYDRSTKFPHSFRPESSSELILD